MAAYPETMDWQSLAQTLANGFQSLLKEVDYLARKEQDLDTRLKYAFEEYVKLASDPSLDSRDPVEREAVTCKILTPTVKDDSASRESVPLNLPKHLDDKKEIRDGFQAFKLINIRSQNNTPKPLDRCPISTMETDSTAFEQDFTTPGVVGNLHCPFAKIAIRTNGVPTPPQDVFDEDPIAAEFHPELRSVKSHSSDVGTSATGAGKCPIRFLDQHSPEEVAEYVEKHKHEIPRSHEVCVKRYQRNTQSIRELDSKYGNLVTMIQGLGVKHQQYLPRNGEHSVGDPSSTGAVERWADQVSHQSEQIGAEILSPTHPPVDEDEDERSGRFQRPLREIRVGESPSRPWGISVPFVPERAPSPAPAPVQPLAQSTERLEVPPSETPRAISPQRRPAGKCPFDHTKMKQNQDIQYKLNNPPTISPPEPVNGLPNGLPNGIPNGLPNGLPHGLPNGLPKGLAPGLSTGLPTQSSQTSQPTMIFNGPVFFGYSAEQAAAMMNDIKRS